MLTTPGDGAVEISDVEREVPGTEIVGPRPQVLSARRLEILQQLDPVTAQPEHRCADPSSSDAGHVGGEGTVQDEPALHLGAQGPTQNAAAVSSERTVIPVWATLTTVVMVQVSASGLEAPAAANVLTGDH